MNRMNHLFIDKNRTFKLIGKCLWSPLIQQNIKNKRGLDSNYCD